MPVRVESRMDHRGFQPVASCFTHLLTDRPLCVQGNFVRKPTYTFCGLRRMCGVRWSVCIISWTYQDNILVLPFLAQMI
jgi:hypothetical protein